VSDKLLLSLLSPERKIFEKVEVTSVNLPGAEGALQILPGHADFVSTLETGPFSFEAVQSQEDFGKSGVISSGFFQVKSGHVIVCAETLEFRGEIDIQRAKKAQEKAQQVLSGAELDEEKFKKYQLKLQRALIRQQEASHS
jgi:F-type H+-transporting ATPase subunit epsilon